MSEHPIKDDRPGFEPEAGDVIPDKKLPEKEGEDEEKQDDPGSAPESGDKDPV